MKMTDRRRREQAVRRGIRAYILRMKVEAIVLITQELMRDSEPSAQLQQS